MHAEIMHLSADPLHIITGSTWK